MFKSSVEIVDMSGYRLYKVTDCKNSVAVQDKIFACGKKNDINVVITASTNNLRSLQTVNFGHNNIQHDELKRSDLKNVKKIFCGRKSLDIHVDFSPILAKIII